VEALVRDEQLLGPEGQPSVSVKTSGSAGPTSRCSISTGAPTGVRPRSAAAGGGGVAGDLELGLAGLALALIPFVRLALRRPHTAASWMLGAGMVWLASATRRPRTARLSGSDVEWHYLDVVRAVRQAIGIPLAVKLSPSFSSLANLAGQLVEAGANGLVLFNRFYQPDLDIEAMEVLPALELSSSVELRLPLRWIAILHRRHRV
jgi:hypothetical protein